MNVFFARRALWAAPFLCFSSLAHAAFSGVTVFGDSLSDQGNVSATTFGFVPGPNYWQGRFSNGRIWAELFATQQGITLTRSTAGGSNYAWGGATTGTGTFGFGFPNVRTQVAGYLGTSPTIDSNRLFVVWAGGNDYLNGGTSPVPVIDNLRQSIQSLHAAGARKFLIPNLPLLGYVPRNVGTANQNAANQISLAHNNLLRSQLGLLRSSLGGATIYEMDVAGRMEHVRQNPALYNLTNVTQPALVGNSVVPNPDQYLFYDDIHPTRVGHAILRNLAVESVPEPATMVALGLGMAVMLRRRRAGR